MFQQLDIAIAFVTVMLLLSLLVTAIVQAISALFDLRGKNLARALSDLLKQIDSGLNAPARTDATDEAARSWLNKIRNWFVHPFTRITLATKIADAVTEHPVLAHTFTRAKSIRKDELMEVLKDLCSDNTIATIDSTAKAKLKQILAAQIPGGVTTVDTAQALANELGNKFPALKEEMNKVLTNAMGSISRLEVGVEKWFDAVMDRASDVFTRWTRTITIVISVSLVLTLHIDAGLILKQVSTDPSVRAGLLKLSDTALVQADETLKPGDRGTTALKTVAEKYSSDPAASDLKNAPSLPTCAEGRHWLEAYASGKQQDVNQLLHEFDDDCQRLTVAALTKSEDQISHFRAELASTNLEIVPRQIGGQSVFGNSRDSIYQRLASWTAAYKSKSHLLGTLAMVVLLSLGAPFWFNGLKQLSNLKPSITQKIEHESTASQPDVEKR